MRCNKTGGCKTQNNPPLKNQRIFESPFTQGALRRESPKLKQWRALCPARVFFFYFAVRDGALLYEVWFLLRIGINKYNFYIYKKAINTENIQKVRDVTAENVAPEDKTDLEKAKADLEQALAVYERNYTENETKTIRDEIKRIDDALRSIENAAAVDALLKTLPDSVTPQNKIDEAIVRDVKAAYDTLSDREKEILNEQSKGKLERFVAILAAGCKGSNTCPSLLFKDIDVKAWYHHGVDYVITNGYMVGYPNHTFAPNKAINRAEMVQILYNLEGRPNVSGRDAFRDTANKAWYSKAILWASQTGLVAGYGNGNFGPEDLITREQMVSILWRYAKYKGIDVLTDEATTLAGFDDAENVSRWALPAVKWAIQTKIMRGIPGGGKKYIAANETATRAQAAVMLRRFDKM